jgi:hypothetical protein
MTRSRTSPRPPNPEPAAEPLDDLLRSHLQWLDQVIGLQTTWLTSCLELQAEFWRHWSAGAQELPAWMVWHNGTEQLA